jgi:hypothetical protein
MTKLSTAARSRARDTFLALVGVACAFPAYAGYEFTAIDYPGIDYSNGGFVSANGINNRREIVGCEQINFTAVR